MSALENFDLEAQLKGEIVARKLYLRGALRSENAITINEIGESFTTMIDGLLYLEDNGLIAEVNGKLVFHGNTTIPTRIEDLKEGDLCLGDGEDEYVKMYYLTPAGRKIIDEQMKVKTSVDGIIKK